MKTKTQPKRGNRIVAVTSYTRLKNGTEILHETIYYVDTKRKMVWEEYGLQLDGLITSWALRQKPKTLKALLAKYHNDFDKFKLMLSDYDLHVQKIGVL